MKQLIRDPIYLQLNQELRRLLESGAYTEGQQFLTEREIKERFAVSRPTANKALANLVAEGRLAFRKGMGTFVARPKLGYELRALASFTDNARASGKKPVTKVLAFSSMKAGRIGDQDIAERLGLAGDDTVFTMQRLRLADDTPVIFEKRVVAAAACPELTQADIEGSIYAAFQERHGLAIAGAEQTIRAVALEARHAELLGVKAGAPALEVTAVGLLQSGHPLWWERTLYRGDAYAFHTRLGPLGNPGTGW